MNAILTALLAVIGEVAPLVTSSSAVGNVIAAVKVLAPIAISTVENGSTIVKNITTALKDNPNITDAQWDDLDAFEATIDADFDAAAAAALAEDAAKG